MKGYDIFRNAAILKTVNRLAPLAWYSSWSTKHPKGPLFTNAPTRRFSSEEPPCIRRMKRTINCLGSARGNDSRHDLSLNKHSEPLDVHLRLARICVITQLPHVKITEVERSLQP